MFSYEVLSQWIWIWYGTDTDTAAQRLRVLAEMFAESTKTFRLDAVSDRPCRAFDLGCGPGYKTLILANTVHHAHPLLVRDGKVQPIVAKGMPLGMMAGINYRDVEFPLESGDVVMFMTDGIIEVHDAQGRKYQESVRLEQALTQLTLGVSAAAMAAAVIDDAMAYGGENTQREDDMTVVVVKVL